MKFIKSCFSYFLTHPAWAGISGLVAIIALIATFQTETSNNEEEQNISNENKQPKSKILNNREYVNQRIALLVSDDYDRRDMGATYDIEIIAKSLRSRNFKIMKITNGKVSEVKEAISKFQTLLSLGGIGLFFYSGYALTEINGDNFLIFPNTVDKLQNISDLEKYAINISQLLRPIDNILDEMPKNNGSITIYSTGRYSLSFIHNRRSAFVRAFLEALENKEHEIFDFYREINRNISKLTDGHQIPSISASIDTEFYFNNLENDENIGLLKLLIFDAIRTDVFGIRSKLKLLTEADKCLPKAP